MVWTKTTITYNQWLHITIWTGCSTPSTIITTMKWYWALPVSLNGVLILFLLYWVQIYTRILEKLISFMVTLCININTYGYHNKVHRLPYYYYYYYSYYCYYYYRNSLSNFGRHPSMLSNLLWYVLILATFDDNDDNIYIAILPNNWFLLNGINWLPIAWSIVLINMNHSVVLCSLLTIKNRAVPLL